MSGISQVVLGKINNAHFRWKLTWDDVLSGSENVVSQGFNPIPVPTGSYIWIAILRFNGVGIDFELCEHSSYPTGMFPQLVKVSIQTFDKQPIISTLRSQTVKVPRASSYSTTYIVKSEIKDWIKKKSLIKSTLDEFNQHEFVVILDISFDPTPSFAPLLTPSLQSLYAALFDKEEYADVVFIVKEEDSERRIFFWKSVLIQKSDYFARLFESEFLENSKSELKASMENTPVRPESPSPSKTLSSLLKSSSSAVEKADTPELEKLENNPEEAKQDQVKTPEIDLRGEGKVISQIQVLDLKYESVRGFLTYLMTDGIEFIPAGGTPKEELWKEATYCYCPKGIYETAHRYDHEELQNVSLACYMKSITVTNIAQELFSEFGQTYSEPRNELVKFFTANVTNVRKQQQLKDLFMEAIEGSAHDEIWAQVLGPLFKA